MSAQWPLVQPNSTLCRPRVGGSTSRQVLLTFCRLYSVHAGLGLVGVRTAGDAQRIAWRAAC